MKHPVIALDGPAGSGKSTIAKSLSKKLSYHYLDSGALYRGLTYLLGLWHLELAPELDFPEFVAKTASLWEEGKDWEGRPQSALSLELQFGAQGENRILVQGEERVEELRTPELTQRIRYIADKPVFRELVNQRIRAVADTCPLVLDGRDIGTVVFPNAPHKFFLVASSRVRAQRRALDLQRQGISVSLDELERSIQERDSSDENRAVAPLACAPDAIRIDTSELSPDDVVKALLSRLPLA